MRYHQEALELFRGVNDRPGLAATYDLLGVTNFMSGDIPSGVQHYYEAIALVRELNDLPALSSSLSFFSMRGLRLERDGLAARRRRHVYAMVRRRYGWRAKSAGARAKRARSSA